MGRRRKRKVEAELIELVRVEITAMRADVQAALAETAAVLSTRVRTELEQRMGEPSALADGIQDIRTTIATHDADLATVLQRVGETCDALAERVQVDQNERAALVDAVGRLTAALTAPGTLLPPPSSVAAERAMVIGGTVDPAQPTPRAVIEPSIELVETGPPNEIDLIEAARAPEPNPTAAPAPAPTGRPVRPDGVEVRCRFGDRWVTGFEVCEVIRTDDAHPLPAAAPIRRVRDPDVVRREGPAVLQHRVRRPPVTAPTVSTAAWPAPRAAAGPGTS